MPHPLEEYLRELRAIRSTGEAVEELSFYGPLAELFNAVGGDLDAEVRCVMNLRNRGAGLPDGGLFTDDQLQDCPLDQLVEGQKPARGAIEVKGTGDEVRDIADTDQVRGYLRGYGQVLVTNLRDFLLIERDSGGEAKLLESYRLAASEGDFWAATQTPRKVATDQGERLVDFLRRVMMHSAPLSAPEDVAWLLASYAREALARVEEAELPALDALRGALEEALGMTFEGERGEHFFRSTLVQTLFYGIFSAWVIWSRDHPPTSEEEFKWHEAGWTLHVPMIAALYQQIAQPTRLGPLGIVEVLDWAADALSRVDRASFFEQFNEGPAVQYFYEPFLQAFDPELRKELGVWYTPEEIVRYMVERVDTALREELDIPDGLADPNVYVLDWITRTRCFWTSEEAPWRVVWNTCPSNPNTRRTCHEAPFAAGTCDRRSYRSSYHS